MEKNFLQETNVYAGNSGQKEADWKGQQGSRRMERGASIAWDLECGDFMRDATLRLISADSKEAYRIWCYKMVRTERFCCGAYPGYLGVELETALKRQTNAAIEAALERTITEALKVNPRTEYVRGFSFQWEGDQVWIEFMVKGKFWNEFQVRIPTSVPETMEKE